MKLFGAKNIFRSSYRALLTPKVLLTSTAMAAGMGYLSYYGSNSVMQAASQHFNHVSEASSKKEDPYKRSRSKLPL